MSFKIIEIADIDNFVEAWSNILVCNIIGISFGDIHHKIKKFDRYTILSVILVLLLFVVGLTY